MLLLDGDSCTGQEYGHGDNRLKVSPCALVRHYVHELYTPQLLLEFRRLLGVSTRLDVRQRSLDARLRH